MKSIVFYVCWATVNVLAILFFALRDKHPALDALGYSCLLIGVLSMSVYQIRQKQNKRNYEQMQQSVNKMEQKYKNE